ncbi:MAG TPA: hypothetical protein VFJ09_13095 [Nocardioidaceae bacterium]|nr:hypothetical protein [Nocardioidaceae bacterium]
MSEQQNRHGLSDEELRAEAGIALPDKEVVSILDLNADINLAIDAAAPIDLAVAANANVAAPINASADANILSAGSSAQSLSDQGALINQNIDATATAHSLQDSGIHQGATGGTDTGGTDTGGTTDGGATSTTTDTGTSALNDGNLLNVNVNVDGNADLAAPVDGAVAANANVAAPINAGVSANVGSIDSQAVSVSEQDAIINQNIEGAATAVGDQTSTIDQ